MNSISEPNIEYGLLGKLADLKYTFRSDIRNRKALEQNFRKKFESLNRVHLTDMKILLILIAMILTINCSFAQGINSNFIPKSLTEEKITTEDGRIVASYPEPIGGMNSFYTFIHKKQKYPKDAKKKSVEGKVYVQFLVNEEGDIVIDSIKIIQPLFPSLDNEAVRLISKLPKWNPGIDESGKPIKMWMIMPIIFKLKRK